MYLSDTRPVRGEYDSLFYMHVCTKWTSVLRNSLSWSISTVQYSTVQYSVVEQCRGGLLEE